MEATRPSAMDTSQREEGGFPGRRTRAIFRRGPDRQGRGEGRFEPGGEGVLGMVVGVVVQQMSAVQKQASRVGPGVEVYG